MIEDPLDRVVSAAREELRNTMPVTPPAFGDLRRHARARYLVAGIAAVIAIAVVVGALTVAGRGDRARVATGPSVEGPNAGLLGPGESRPLAQSPLAGRSTMAAVWTGNEMIIWGGDSPTGQFDDGATYQPSADTWNLLPKSPLSARNAPAAVWTGHEVLLWGGASNGASYRDGAAYNPATRRWRSIADAPFESAGRPIAIWTGTEMIVLAGFNSSQAAAYDPATDQWHPLPQAPGALQAPNPVAIWTGDEVVTVVRSGGASPDAPGQLVALRPGSAGWSRLHTLPTGQAVLGWSGDGTLVAAGREAFEFRDHTLSPIASAPPGNGVGDTPAVWSGSELFLWNGDTASAIDPATKTWRAIPSGDTTARAQPAVVWADGILIAWGGFPAYSGGVMLRPPTTTQPPASITSRPLGQRTADVVTEKRLRSVFDASLQCMAQAGLIVRDPQLTVTSTDVQAHLTLDYTSSAISPDQASAIDGSCRTQLIALSDAWHANGAGSVVARKAGLRNYSLVADANGKLVTRDGYIVLISPGSPAVNSSPTPPDSILPDGKVSQGASSARASDQVDAALTSGHAVFVPIADPSLDAFCTRSALTSHSCGIGSSQADKL